MPKPRKGQTQKEFVAMCIPIVMKEKGTKDRKHAIAKCHGIWRQHRGGEKPSDSEIIVVSDNETLEKIIRKSTEELDGKEGSTSDNKAFKALHLDPDGTTEPVLGSVGTNLRQPSSAV